MAPAAALDGAIRAAAEEGDAVAIGKAEAVVAKPAVTTAANPSKGDENANGGDSATTSGATAEAAVPKKKKKKKKPRKSNNNNNNNNGQLEGSSKKDGAGSREEGSAAGSDDSVVDVVAELADGDGDVDTLDAWKAKAKQRLALLHDLRGEVVRARAESCAATERAREAEDAETVASSGVNRASALLEEKERVNGELGGTVNALRVELAAAVEERKKAEKKMGMVKALGEKAREAREAREVAERKCEEMGREVGRAKGEVGALKEEVERVEGEGRKEVEKVREELGREVEAIEKVCEGLREEGRRGMGAKVWGGVGGVGGLIVGLVIGGLGRKGSDSMDSPPRSE